ncbi:MAG: tRNA modification GTPase [Flavobacteriales bacterium]|jgi:tRNA modification GTPase
MNLPDVKDTICALSTPSGMGALAIIRLSGKESFNIFSKIFSNKKISETKSHTAHFGLIKKDDVIIDEVVAVIFKGPNSFTGEDTVEISCHGSTYVQREIFNLLIENGARLAQAGEYTMRAYLNGKMDLSRAEAVTDLISSESAAAHRVAMHQMRGGFSSEIGEFRSKLIDFASLIELELDFGEEDVEFADRTQLIELIDALQAKTTDLIKSFRTGNAIKNGVPVAIIGSPNAGKSTLLNALLNDDKALVSDIAGTTRDSIEDIIDIDGVLFRFIDTAGIRETDDVVENLGIERAVKKANEARIIILLVDISSSTSEEINEDIMALKNMVTDDEQEYFIVLNKIDQLDDDAEVSIVSPAEIPVLSISAKDGDGISELKNSLSDSVSTKIGDTNQTLVTNIRHFQVLQKVDESLKEVRSGLDTNLSGDLLAIDIRKALYHLGEVTGETTADDLLGNIFSRFCIGK